MITEFQAPGGQLYCSWTPLAVLLSLPGFGSRLRFICEPVMNIVLISTYELGRQPFGVVSPAAWLRKRGQHVTCFDLTRQSLDHGEVASAELMAIYLPMHTATRLAAQLIPELRRLNPRGHLCCYGLYAPMNVELLQSLGVQTLLGGEFESGLVDLAEQLSSALPERSSPSRNADVPQVQTQPLISLERLQFEVPDRRGLPPIEKYAHLLIPGDGYRLVGSTEASRGCKHLCRHCPIVPVYKGVFRIVQREVVLEDIRRQVAVGAQHISFGDPDFFNGIGHSLEIIKLFHEEFPAVTYDATIKIEHLKKHSQHLLTLRETGCLFVTSAVESVDNAFLQILDKGHTREDFLEVVATFRKLDITLQPTFVPFSPWTTMESFLDLLRVVHGENLVENVAPIQLGIRLLIPAGSRLLELSEVQSIVGEFDPHSLVFPWWHVDPRMDALSIEIQQIAAAADAQKLSRSAAFTKIWQAAHHAAGIAAPELATQLPSIAVPFLSEPWYCCAEPTPAQFVSIGATSSQPLVPSAVQPAPAKPPAVSADQFV
jgi:radical SAM superfamily enzyme YgiQ (UPF0313 family)